MEESSKEALIQQNKWISPSHSAHESSLESASYSSSLKWVFLDYSNIWTTGVSWSLFFLLNIAVPIVSHFIFYCSDCDTVHQRPYDAVVQSSLSLFAAISFVCLTSFGRKYGLRRFLFLDKMCDESEKVRQGYAQQLQRSMKLLSAFVLPIFLSDCVYQIWWFASKGNQIPYPYNTLLCKIIGCMLLMCSWLFRISMCFLVCVLFRLTCCLQILRLEDFAQVFERESDVASILIEHLRIRRNLRIISHRFRVFILSTLTLVTISQFVSLLITTEPSSRLNIPTAGELTLCSITLVTGLLICLRSAAKITHRAQAVTSLAAKWHACATIESFDALTDGIQTTPIVAAAVAQHPVTAAIFDSDNEEGDGDNALDNTNLVPIFANTVSYQKRQALESKEGDDESGKHPQHVPKFGNWDGNDVPYTACFENARKEKNDGVRINPNDPQENPEAFDMLTAAAKLSPVSKKNRFHTYRFLMPRNQRDRGDSMDDSSGQSCRSVAVPKFGEWDEKNPTGFTVIFDKVKEERHIAAAKFPSASMSVQQDRNKYHLSSHKQDTREKKMVSFMGSLII
ncbi:hypothetical protein F511_05889 [Dorcoceras hygrometricum]|uniref:RIN4 pathogenic type III effector avirulence factor Avr cleavage site domain-containing protein n=1 Tax=Dorcoceras hygrometricum TaxID=472368 RepID=A0A2Z7CVW9_9LAMI|nr:hypothetical protein F511_05889 [Dorcoceras hygrometricum]